ncbi:MAG: PTS galactitol transporter subunit IIA [Rhodospirillaceae bacterium]|nr:PTS galactitol transporter subunit IIA [Rhodospirillaceae bacterium]
MTSNKYDHRKEAVVVNRRGLHARAAVKIASLAEKHNADVNVISNGVLAPATSIMSLMLLAAGPGDKLCFEATGADALLAIDELTSLVNSGFNEDCDGCYGKK